MQRNKEKQGNKSILGEKLRYVVAQGGVPPSLNSYDGQGKRNPVIEIMN